MLIEETCKMISRPGLLVWLFSLLSVCVVVPLHAIGQNKASGETLVLNPQALTGEATMAEELEPSVPTGISFNALGSEIQLNGYAAFNAEYLDVADLEDPRREDSLDFSIGSLELAMRVIFNDWSKLKIVVSAEDFGKNGEKGRVIMSEATATLEAPWAPLYLILGRTAMPFGVFEDRLIEGTLTEEVYEIDDVGMILGFAPDFYGLDLSVAIYEEPAIIDNLEEFDVFERSEGRPHDDRFDSFVLNCTAEPLEDALYLSIFYDNEPGDGRRNQSIGSAVGVTVWRLNADAEWIAALTRESGENEVENRESAWTAGLSFELTEVLDLAGRYERFNDDDSGEQDEVLVYRWVAGGNYQFGEWTMLSLEYRYSKFEKEPDSDIEDQQHMVQLQLTFEY